MAVNYFCLRNILLTCFVLLGVSGIVVCAAGSFFVHQLREKNFSMTVIDNLEGSPTTLLIMGLFTCAIAVYFWFVIDYKYNRPQFIMFSIMLLLVSIIEACAGAWALVQHEQLDALLSTSLEENLTVPKNKYSIPSLNYTEVKLSCCGYYESDAESEVKINSRSCCDFERLINETKSICEDLHETECRHLTINRDRSILLHVFLLALCSIILQIFIMTSMMYYAKFLKKQKTRRGRRRSLQHQKSSTP